MKTYLVDEEWIEKYAKGVNKDELTQAVSWWDKDFFKNFMENNYSDKNVDIDELVEYIDSKQHKVDFSNVNEQFEELIINFLNKKGDR